MLYSGFAPAEGHDTTSVSRAPALSPDRTKSAGGLESGSSPADEQLQCQGGEALKIAAFPDSGSILSGTFPIDNDGYVDFPLIGMTKVIHETPREIEQYLTAQYKVFLPRQHMIVRLMFRTALVGGFLKPGVYWVDPHGSLWDVIQLGGGTLREDGIKKIQWVHGTDGKIKTMKLLPYLQSEQSLLDIGFKSGDQLTVSAIPKRGTWEFFKDGFLPVISIVASLLMTYEVIQIDNNNKN